MIDYLAVFIFFFSVIDPIGTVPVFIAVTQPFSIKKKRKIALQATLASGCILLFFVIAGEVILTAIDIPLAAFQVSGGLVLFVFALSMIFGESKPDEELRMEKNHTDTAIFPLAVPSIASPGAMLAAVLLTENNQFSLLEQALTATIMISVLVITYFLMLLAGPIDRLIGNSGASVISRVMGLILASVAVSNVLAGIKEYFAL